jgi:DNA-directed RNA polymerase subunit omega
MSVVKPEIDSLLEKTEHNPFLLCSVASKRACDINNMMRGQHLRVTAIQEVDDITTVLSGKDTISIAMDELVDDTLGYVAEDFDEAIKDTNAPVSE